MHAACPSTKRKLGISNFDLLLIFQQRPWWHARSAAAVHNARTIGERTVSQPFAGTDGLSAKTKVKQVSPASKLASGLPASEWKPCVLPMNATS